MVGDVGDLANTVTYHGGSRLEGQIESVELFLGIYNERLADDAVEAYKPMVNLLFRRLDLEMPNGLQEAADDRKSFASDEPYGTVQLKRDENRPGFGFILRLMIDVATESESAK